MNSDENIEAQGGKTPVANAETACYGAGLGGIPARIASAAADAGGGRRE